MDADHNSISKYKDEQDPNYIKLKDTLANMLQKGQSRLLDGESFR